MQIMMSPVMNHPVQGLSGLALAIEERAGASPFIIEFSLVQGTGFTCMAYRDADGKWLRAFDNHELPGFISILE